MQAREAQDGGSVTSAGRILVCLRWGIGDVTMMLPVLEALRRAAPQARIEALGAEPALALLGGKASVDACWSVSSFGLGHWGDVGTTATRKAVVAWLGARDFDLVLDAAHAATAVRTVLWESGLRLIDSDAEVEQQVIARRAGGWLAIQEGVRRGWGIAVPHRAAPRLSLRPEEREAAHEILGGQRPAAISAVASSPLKQWPLERWIDLARGLRSEGPVLLVESPDDAADGAALRRRLEDGALLAPGALPLRHAAAVLAGCRVLVCNDTGLMHLAASVGTPVVGIFGPTQPALYLPGWGRAAAAADGHACWWRDTARLGPPECVRLGRCLVGRDGCIDGADPQRVLALARSLAAPAPRRDRDAASRPNR